MCGYITCTFCSGNVLMIFSNICQFLKSLSCYFYLSSYQKSIKYLVSCIFWCLQYLLLTIPQQTFFGLTAPRNMQGGHYCVSISRIREKNLYYVDKTIMFKNQISPAFDYHLFVSCLSVCFNRNTQITVLEFRFSRYSRQGVFAEVLLWEKEILLCFGNIFFKNNSAGQVVLNYLMLTLFEPSV